MKVTRLRIPEVLLVEPRVFADERGYFMEVWHARKYAEAGLNARFVQDNQSFSKANVLRGLHYQVDQPQGKLVRAIQGAIYDVAVDIRPDSPTYGTWVGVELSADNCRQLWIPAGLAHGFLVRSTTAEVLYKTTDYYAPAAERCILWNDPTIAIAWPLKGEPVVSLKDRQGTTFAPVAPRPA